ncbi:MAG: hypothetical protein LBG83_07555 [Oscillospiraceae bacterium]|jgi:hypothetical protein|nr:hypothetical protein [Oscillospiraceae bacterium]
MPIPFSDAIRLREPRGAADAARLAALLGEDEAGPLGMALDILRDGIAKTEAAPWGVVYLPTGRHVVFCTISACDGGWAYSLRAADLSRHGRAWAELAAPQLLPEAPPPADPRFAEALRDAAFLVCAGDPGSALRCKIGEDQRELAMAILRDLLENAVAPQHLRFLSFIAGTGELPPDGFLFRLGRDAAPPELCGAFVDFVCAPAALELRFSALNFAQRSVRGLLPQLGRAMLLSMWDAAQRQVIETMGAQAAQAPDLVAWEMLRRNFARRKFPITEPELRALQAKLEAFSP